MVLDVLGDTVNLVLGLVDFYLGVSCRDGVDLSIGLFLFEYGTLSYANGQLYLVC